MYLNSLSGIYTTPTLFILQYFSVRTKDFSSEIWYNKIRIGCGFMVEKIMQDNQMYLTEWMRYNPSLQEVLRLDGNFLCYKDQERLDISQIYLPEILYNEPFRNDLANPEEMNGYDFFQIIKIYSQTNEILEKEKKEALKYPVIQDMTILKDEQGVEFIVFADIYGKKYRYVTKEPHKILELYQNLKNEKGNITIKDLGSVIQYANQK